MAAGNSGAGSGVLAKYLIQIALNTGPITKQLDAIEKRILALGEKKAALSARTSKEEAAQLRTLKQQLGVDKSKLDIKSKELGIKAKELRVQQLQERVARRQALAGPPLPPGFRRGGGGRGRGSSGTMGPPLPPGFRRTGMGRRGPDPEYFRMVHTRAKERTDNLLALRHISQTDHAKAMRMLNSATTVQQVRQVGLNLKTATEQMRILNKEFTVGGFLANKLKTSTQQMMGGYVGAFAAAGAATGIVNTGMDYESAAAAMVAAAGSKEARDQQMEYVKNLSRYLGTDITANAESYAKVLFATKGKMSTEQTQALFTGAQEFGTVMGVDRVKMNLGMRAIQQMLSKTTVMSEELRGQLAENIPGSIAIFQKAFEKMTGLDEKEMFKWMEQGKLISAEIMPYVAQEFANAAREGGALDETLKKTRVTMGQMQLAFKETFIGMYEGGLDEGLSAFFMGLKEWAEATRPMWVEFAKVLGKVLKLVGKLLEAFGNIYDSIQNIIEAITGDRGNTLYVILGLWLGRIVMMTKAFRVFLRALSMLGVGGAVFSVLKRGAMLLLLPFAKWLSILTSIYLLLQEIGNIWASPDKKLYGLLSNPEGTGWADQMGLGTTSSLDPSAPFNAALSTRWLPADMAAKMLYGNMGASSGQVINAQHVHIDLPNVKDAKSFSSELSDALAAGMISISR